MTHLPVRNLLIVSFFVSLMLLGCGAASDADRAGGSDGISGRIEAGLRVLTFDPAATDQHFTIYRGDYVRPELPSGDAFTLEIPALEVARSFPATGDESPYFKVPDAGTYEFKLGNAAGVIEAIEYTAAQYREVRAREASEMIANVRPHILDVRTPGEFASGHIENAVVIPVQQLQSRLRELEEWKSSPVLVYCATGNRSTVAAKLMIDAGFEQVTNMRRGIREWVGEGLPTVK